MKSFKRKEQLTLHIVIHSGKKRVQLDWHKAIFYQFNLHFYAQARKSMYAMSAVKDSIARITWENIPVHILHVASNPKFRPSHSQQMVPPMLPMPPMAGKQPIQALDLPIKTSGKIDEMRFFSLIYGNENSFDFIQFRPQLSYFFFHCFVGHIWLFVCDLFLIFLCPVIFLLFFFVFWLLHLIELRSVQLVTFMNLFVIKKDIILPFGWQSPGP